MQAAADKSRRKKDMPTGLDTLVACLTKAQSEFLRAADLIPATSWRRRPEEGRWSAAELVQHLVAVEKGVLEKADRVSQKTPRKVAFFKRFHLPMVLVEWRFVRLKSPIAVNSETLLGKEDMLAELRHTRERSLAFLEETKERELGVYLWRHPALGMLDTYGWLRFLAAHQNRHAKQMREITTALRKPI
jgi:DinB superfamily